MSLGGLLAVLGLWLASQAFAVRGRLDIPTVIVGVPLLVLGAAVVATGYSERLRLKARPLGEARLSEMAESMLHRVYRHIGYHDWQREVWGSSLARQRGFRSSADVLPPGLFELLEPAAFEFNRVEGLLLARASAVDRALYRLTPAIRAASDEAMTVVLNHAARLEAFPEHDAEPREAILARIADLRELADRLHELVRTFPNNGSSGADTVMGDVLERLREEQLARLELPPVGGFEELDGR